VVDPANLEDLLDDRSVSETCVALAHVHATAAPKARAGRAKLFPFARVNLFAPSDR
jgi:hypothetical protein